MSKIGTTWIAIAVFIAGLLIGGLGGAFAVTLSNVRYQTDAIAFSLLDTSASMVPLLIALGEKDEDMQLALIESVARSQLIAGIVSLNASVPLVSEKKGEMITNFLRTVALKREKLKVGKYSDPPLDHIEETLAAYAD